LTPKKVSSFEKGSWVYIVKIPKDFGYFINFSFDLFVFKFYLTIYKTVSCYTK